MNIRSENQLLAIDETCLSELSEENESTISGGTLGLLSWIFGGIFGYPKSQPTTTTIVNNNYNTIYVNTTSGASSTSGGSTGGGYHK